MITSDQLLSGWSDSNGDLLFVDSLATESSDGTLIDHGNGAWSFVPVDNFYGDVALAYGVSDGSLLVEATASLLIQSVNDVPVLSGAPVELPSGTEDVPYVLKESDLLKGYSDVDGDQLFISSVTTLSANGVINLNGDASWTYLPAIDRTGDVHFEFIVSDGNGGSANGMTTLALDPARDTEVFDEDNNGIVDGSEFFAYQLLSDAGAVTLQNKKGKTYSNGTSGAWDAVVAIEAKKGFEVLLEGEGSRKDQFKVWSVKANGVISKGSSWKSAYAATGLGWEEKFSFDTNADGIIGGLVDDDGNGIADGSEFSAYQLLSEAGAVTLQNKKGKTYSNGTSGAWDAVVAIEAKKGFEVLLEGEGSRKDQFKVWSVKANGVISKGSSWKSAYAATGLGWEEKFSFDTNADGIIGGLVDDDGNGLVDDVTNYQIVGRAGPITIKNRQGGKYSDASTHKWDARAAVQVDSGYQVLLEGTSSQYRDQYIIWTTDLAGTIINASGWKSGDELSVQGAEVLFGLDLNADGII